jgi:choline kinase
MSTLDITRYRRRIFDAPPDRFRRPDASLHAIILSAGQGRRLGALTATMPKCLLPVGDNTVLEWQIKALRAAGMDSCTVVVGFQAEQVEQLLARRIPPAARVRTLLNPLFDRADNLVSCWAAREQMDGDFLLLNGDTLFEPRVVERLISSAPAPVTLAVRRKRAYDADDMKVICADGVLRRIGKDLPTDETNAESIGMLLFRGDGPRLFRERLDAFVRTGRASRSWYVSIIDDMAAAGLVRTRPVDGLRWAEIDYASDLEAAGELVARWSWCAVPEKSRRCA